MKIKQVKLKNFRGYKTETVVNLEDLTVFVGKNDIGKSTILEALDIFINEGKGVAKMDRDDINKTGLSEGDSTIEIAVVFGNLPESIVIDSTNSSSLQSEYLLNSNGDLEILKKFPNAGKEKVFIRAFHPTNNECNDLLLKKITELRTILSNHSIECEDQTRSAVIRNAIWTHFNAELNLEEIELDASKGDTKDIWEKLKNYLPLYSLFQADRKNSDGDSEVQDPMKLAVKEILSDPQLTQSLNDVAAEVERKLHEVASQTLDKLNEMNPEVADSLTPVIPPANSLKWMDVFKNVSITGDNDIPINKRGSGIKRLILLNFFRAEADRRRVAENLQDIVYAIEEPETSQHTDHQRTLINAFIELSSSENTQIFLTTHSPAVVKSLQFGNLKMVTEVNGEKSIEEVQARLFPYPSLNEVNYNAFKEITEEFHNELYGFIEGEGHLNEFKNNKPTIPYIRLHRNGNTSNEEKILTEYVRHQIHHPENTHNDRFTQAQLEESISLMRSYIQQEMN